MYGTGLTLGLTDGTNTCGLASIPNAGAIARTGAYNIAIGDATGVNNITNQRGIGVTLDPSCSGVVADISFVDGFAPTFLIKY